ncbi:type IV pilus modification protein PilV [Halomonas sediminis]
MRRQRGFSLIEALVALLVLSFGLVGVAAMQLKALQSATAGYQRSVATLAAVDAQERLWAELVKMDQDSEDTRQDCSEIEDDYVKGIETNWQEDWFESSTATPLRQFSGNISGGDEECEFNIEIVFDSDPDSQDSFMYTFRLPKLEES